MSYLLVIVHEDIFCQVDRLFFNPKINTMQYVIQNMGKQMNLEHSFILA